MQHNSNVIAAAINRTKPSFKEPSKIFCIYIRYYPRIYGRDTHLLCIQKLYKLRHHRYKNHEDALFSSLFTIGQNTIGIGIT